MYNLSAQRVNRRNVEGLLFYRDYPLPCVLKERECPSNRIYLFIILLQLSGHGCKCFFFEETFRDQLYFDLI